jgi:hypothetical protein
MTREDPNKPNLVSHALKQCNKEEENDQDQLCLQKEYARFLVATKGDEKEAQRRMEDRVSFRCHQGNILETPHPHFFTLKTIYHHGILGKTGDGSYVMVDSMGRFHQSMKEWHRQGVRQEDVLHHSMLIMEWFCTHVDPRPYPGGRFIRFYDFEGLRIQHVRNISAIRLGMNIISMIERYYPERLEKCIVINAPPVIRHLWNSIVKNMLDPRTAEKFVMCKKEDTLRVMKELLPLECLPSEYGGTAAWYGSAEEQQLFSLVRNINESFGVKS